MANGWSFNKEDAATNARRHYTTGAQPIIENNYFRFLRSQNTLMSGRLFTCTFGQSFCGQGVSDLTQPLNTLTPSPLQISPREIQISPPPIQNIGIVPTPQIGAGPNPNVATGPPPPGPPPPPPNNPPLGVNINNPFRALINTRITGPNTISATTTPSFDQYANLIIQDLNDNPNYNVTFSVPGLHPGNRVFPNRWTDNIRGFAGPTRNDFFNSITSFLDDYFQSRGIDPDRVNTVRGALLREDQGAQTYQYNTN